PHNGPGAVVVVVVVVEDVVLVDVLLVVVVVVLATSGAQVISTLRPPARVSAQAAPVNFMARPRLSRALGAVMKARTSALALRCRVDPGTFGSGVGVPVRGRKVVALSSRTVPCTLIVDWLLPATLMVACLPVRIWHTL